ncbi:MAG: glycoside hydrolase family 127 protein [Lachnospiraceae bacterium]
MEKDDRNREENITRVENRIGIRQFRIRDPFWDYYEDLVLHTVLPYQEKILNDAIPGIEKSHALENFRIAAGRSKGSFYGMVFQDSDVAKWAEAVSNAIAANGDPTWEGKMEKLIDLLAEAQETDGYLDTYFQIKEPDKKWENLQEAHELYCMGHMIEAAVAHFEATGKRNFLQIGVKLADCIDRRFGKGKKRGIPGHPEIEEALLRLYDATKEVRYRNLAAYFINERGTRPNYFKEEAGKKTFQVWGMDPEDTPYFLNDRPVRQMNHAEGHAVRALYLYTAMADLAGRTNDQALYHACLRIWDNITHRQMYVTGSVGQTAMGEAFTIDYDLPNDTAYGETCASVAMIFFGRQLLQIHPDGKVADVMERVLLNGMLAGMQHDGKRFFYVNPLEVDPSVDGKVKGYEHVLPKRPAWYACACCPPNAARLLTSLPRYAYGENGNTIYCHLFLGGTYISELIPGVELTVTSEFPWNGKVTVSVNRNPEHRPFTLALRLPGYAKDVSLTRNGAAIPLPQVRDGYLLIPDNWQENDQITMTFAMPIQRLRANGKVRKDAGGVCLVRGPIVYCLESCDNGKELWNLVLPRQVQIKAQRTSGSLGDAVCLHAEGYREVLEDTALYTEKMPEEKTQQLTFVPYFLWGNREPGEMRVWIRES